jgi:hypothetical protein
MMTEKQISFEIVGNIWFLTNVKDDSAQVASTFIEFGEKCQFG